MRKLLFNLMIFAIIICLFPQFVFAKTGYVSDMLVLTFRQGPGSSYAVIKTVKSNTPVLILEEKNDFYQVELQSKEIGWVDKKFIVFDLPKTVIIDQLKQENKTLENKILTLESLNQTLKEQITSREREYSQKTDSLEISSNTAPDEKKNPAHLEELERLRKKNKDLFKTGMIKWFLAGVGVLLTGWVIGQSVSSKKRRSSSLIS